MTFRANFLIDSITSMAWMLLNLAFYLLVFRYTSSIGDNTGWQQYQFFVFFATSMVINALVQTFFMTNVDELTDLIRTGGLDFILLKPIDTQFLVSLRRVEWSSLSNFVLGLVMLGYALLRLAYVPGPIQVVLYLVYVVCGVAIYYSLMIALASATVWMGRNLTLYDFWFYITTFSRYPMEIYDGPVGSAVAAVLHVHHSRAGRGERAGPNARPHAGAAELAAGRLHDSGDRRQRGRGPLGISVGAGQLSQREQLENLSYLGHFPQASFDCAIPFLRGEVKDGIPHRHVGLGPLAIPSPHGRAGNGVNRLLAGAGDDRVVQIPGERRNEFGQQLAAGYQHGHRPDISAGVQQGANRGFRVIADQGADFRRARGKLRAAVERDLDFRVIVLQVAVGGQGPEVDPLSYVGVAEESVVILVGIALDDRLFHLAADAAHGADGIAFAALGAQQDRLAADVTGPFDAGEGMDFRLNVNEDRPMLGIEDDHRMDPGAAADKDVALAAADGAGLLDLGLGINAAASGSSKILA